MNVFVQNKVGKFVASSTQQSSFKSAAVVNKGKAMWLFFFLLRAFTLSLLLSIYFKCIVRQEEQ